MRTISFKKKKMKLLTNEQQESYGSEEIYYICKECHYTGKGRGAAFTISNLKYSAPNKIPIAFHNGSN